MKMKTFKRTALFIVTLLLLSGSGCSYVMDGIEGAITKRASFSIDVTGSGSTRNISWYDASVDLSLFAGYEIYISAQPNTEESKYNVLYSPYNLSTGNTDVTLASIGTKSKTGINLSSFHGVYFIRVGVVNWDDDSDNIATWKGTPSVYYPLHTELDQISGSYKITLP
jgi:hypothetical protein